MSKPIKLCNISHYQSFIDKFDTFLLDCDGKKLLFITNNSAKSRANYLEKFKKLNIEAYEDEIFCSSYASAYYLKNVLKFPKEKKIYIVGESGIADELALEGIRHCGLSVIINFLDNNIQTFKSDDIVSDPEVGAVVCGLDRYINYTKLAKALHYLKSNSDCIFLVTNDDATFPLKDFVAPGAGSIAASIIKAVGREPDGIMGKPNKPMMDCIAQKFKLNNERTCMIGDRLETDVQFGINGGISTLAVLTGITAEKDLLVNDAPIIPDYYMTSFGDFSKLF
ncbi:4130_t:CDS:2 [Gigaspora rosea]|nr:4130_t:CDS:2 [Gigaspora rosea]